jgi:hypothetical protein
VWLFHLFLNFREALFSFEDFIAALKETPPGAFMYEEHWNVWNDFLNISPRLP